MNHDDGMHAVITKLKRGERCPLHKRQDCCGRTALSARGKESEPKWRSIGPGVRQYPDGHVERTPAALRAVKNSFLRAGQVCMACKQGFSDYRDVELGHKKSKGSGGWKRDDDISNLGLLHVGANRAQGSTDLETYLAEYWKPEHCE